MKKSTRALAVMVAFSVATMIVAGWLVLETRTGVSDPARLVGQIVNVASAAIGAVTAVLLVRFFEHRKRGA